MIKCNITACGTIGRDASMRTTKEEKTFLTFPLRVVLQGKDGRNEKLYFNLFADRIGPAADIADSIKGELSFRGKVGKNIEERKDKKDKSYTMFSAFSTEKVDENFEYQWVRFFCFDRQREEWLQPGVKVEAKGEMTVSVHNGKPDISCRVEELTQYIPESDNFNQ